MTDVGPVRVSRFEWERLMMMSVPHPQNLKLLPVGIFMSADGGDARPGNTNLAHFGPHEKTWAKLLRWAVNEGWLLLVQRGGARRGPNGTTVVRASVYAASVPQLVWKRREEILGSPPFRAAGFEGSATGQAADALKGAPEGSQEALKGAPGGSLVDADSLKGASGTPFNSLDLSLKGAPRDSLPDSLKGASEGFEGSVSRFEGSAQTLPHQAVTPSTSTTPPDAPVTESSVGQGGGGGIDPQLLRPASELVAALNYRGRVPTVPQKRQLSSLVARALTVGWTQPDLKAYLDLGNDQVRSPAAVYLHRLGPEQLPDAPASRPAPKPMPGCAQCDDGYYDTGNGWAPCPHCNRSAA